MTNPFYPHSSGLPTSQTRALASQVSSEFDLIATGFGLLPTPAQLAGGSSNFAADTGSANTLVIAISTNVTALTDGLTFNIRAAATNTGATTLAPGALGATAVVRTDGTVLQAGDITSGQILTVTYSSVMAKFQLTTSGAGVSATAAAASAAAAAASAASATNAANVSGTSTSSNAIPATVTGSKSFTYVESSRATAIGMYLMCADTAAPSTNFIIIQVTAFNSGTKVVTGDVVAVKGSGTKTAWTITLTGKPGAQPIDVQVFAASGTWTMPAAASMVLVELWGAGGGGGAATDASGLHGIGGNGGGYVPRFFAVGGLTSTVSVTIGAGGLGQTVSGNTTPTVGGNTTFGAFSSASGGQTTAGGGILVGTAGMGEAGATAVSGISDRGGARSGTAAGANGGSAVLGGSAGGTGGSVGVGGAGGTISIFGVPTAGGGGTAGASSTTGGAGGAGSSVLTWVIGGGGGGGGGAGTAGAGGVGGAGGVACGGGGGGVGTTTHGNGGKGGDGYARITSW